MKEARSEQKVVAKVRGTVAEVLRLEVEAEVVEGLLERTSRPQKRFVLLAQPD